jgi:hypothetical protein
MSSASVTGVAPCLIRPLVPSARGSSGEPGTAKNFAALFKRKPRGNQRTGTLGRFDNDNAKGQTRDQPIAARKVACPRLPAERHFSQSQPGAQDVIEEVGVLRRVNSILAAGENGDGPGHNAGAVRSGIDAARKARHNGKSSLAKSARQALGDLHAGGRRIARADDRHWRQSEHGGITADGNQGRRVIDHLQPARIMRLAARDQRNAEFAASLDLTFGLFARANLRCAGAAAARQCRQRFERRACSAEMVEQRAKRTRADILTADEPQPVEPLLIRQTYWFKALAHPSPERSVQSPHYRQDGTERACCKTCYKPAQSGLPQG